MLRSIKECLHLREFENQKFVDNDLKIQEKTIKRSLFGVNRRFIVDKDKIALIRAKKSLDSGLKCYFLCYKFLNEFKILKKFIICRSHLFF